MVKYSMLVALSSLAILGYRYLSAVEDRPDSGDSNGKVSSVNTAKICAI